MAKTKPEFLVELQRWLPASWEVAPTPNLFAECSKSIFTVSVWATSRLDENAWSGEIVHKGIVQGREVSLPIFQLKLPGKPLPLVLQLLRDRLSQMGEELR
jgi:hypothetical protein